MTQRLLTSTTRRRSHERCPTFHAAPTARPRRICGARGVRRAVGDWLYRRQVWTSLCRTADVPALRMGTVVVLLGAILSLTRPKWPGARGVAHSAVTGLLVHGLGLGGVFVAIGNGLSAGMVALVLSLQPVLTSTIASRWLGERVRLLQWVGLALGLFGIYLIVRDKATTAAPRRSHGRRARLGFSASRSARFIKSASVARSTGARRFACNMRRRDFCLCSGRPSSKPAS